MDMVDTIIEEEIQEEEINRHRLADDIKVWAKNNELPHNI